MLSRKLKRFIVFFACLYVVYFTLVTLNSNSSAHQQEDIVEDDEKFLVNTHRPQKAKPKNFDSDPVPPPPKYHHDDIVYVESNKDAAIAVEAKEEPVLDIVLELQQQEKEKEEEKPNIQLFFDTLFDIYMRHFPQISPIMKLADRGDADNLEAVNVNDETLLSEKFLSDRILVDDKQFQELASKHRSVIDELSILQPLKYQGDGVVMIAGSEEELLLSLLVVNVLRSELKSSIAIEITFKEYPSVCDSYLPSLNVTCTSMLENFSPKILDIWNFDRHLFKSLLILNSRFRNVLLLDPTTFPLEDPQLFFKEQPFKSYGLVLWPDYWKRMTSPLYYKIVDRTIDTFQSRVLKNEFVQEQKTTETDFFSKISLHDRGGTIQDGTTLNEIIMIDKVKHFQTLLLSLYYNINGNDFYYPLLTNFAHRLGGGEKETLLALLTFLDLKYYQLKKNCDVIGSWFNNKFNGVGIKQYDCIKDFRNIVAYKRNRGDFNKQINDNDKVSFLTINNPNLTPRNLLQNFNLLRDLEDGSRIRLLGENLKDVGYDLELLSFDFYKNMICDLKIDMFNENRKELCKFVNLQLTFLKSSNKDLKFT